MANELECIVDSELAITEETPYTSELTPAIEELPAESSEFRNMRPGGMDGLLHELYGMWSAFTGGFNGLIWETNLTATLSTYWSFDKVAHDAQREKIDSICRQRYPHGGYIIEYTMGRAASAATELGIGTGILLASYSLYRIDLNAGLPSLFLFQMIKSFAREVYVEETGYRFYRTYKKQLPEKGQCLLESI